MQCDASTSLPDKHLMVVRIDVIEPVIVSLDKTVATDVEPISVLADHPEDEDTFENPPDVAEALADANQVDDEGENKKEGSDGESVDDPWRESSDDDSDECNPWDLEEPIEEVEELGGSSTSKSSTSSSTSESDEGDVEVTVREIHDSWHVDELGELKFDHKLKYLAAHCPYHANCRCNRTLKANARNKAAGRPIGFLLAWLAAGRKFKSQKKHSKFATKIHKKELSFDRRAELRFWAEGHD